MRVGRTSPTAEGRCPRCGLELAAATGLDHDHRIKAGDFCVCARCGQLMKIDDDGEPVLALERELEELTEEQRHAIQSFRVALERYGPPPGSTGRSS